MLKQLYHKRNPLITTVVYVGIFFKKSFKTITFEKNVRQRYHFCKNTDKKLLNYFTLKMIFLSIL